MNDEEKEPFWGPSKTIPPGFYVMLAVMMIVLISVMSIVTISIEEAEDRAECECKEACEKLGYDFLRTEYEQGYLSKIECYCQDGNKTVKILY